MSFDVEVCYFYLTRRKSIAVFEIRVCREFKINTTYNMPTTMHPEVDIDSILENHAHSLFDDYPRNMTESHFDHHEINHYHLSFYFEMAVEFINSLAGVLVLMAVCLAGVNLIIVGINSMTGTLNLNYRYNINF